MSRAGSGTLWLVATPIGNLGDLPPRAVEVLAASALVCCEDTRRTGSLLKHAGVSARRMAICNEHTEVARIDAVLEALSNGDDVAVVTDAGTPGISDPGERLVRAAIDAGHPVSAVPGPTAAIMALTISGLATRRFVFEGFLPRKGRERQQRLSEIGAEHRTVVLYEAPHRVERTIADLHDVCGPDRRVVVTRELTKLHETVVRGPLGGIALGEPRGEYVLVLQGAPAPAGEADDDVVRSALRAQLTSGATTRDAVATVAEQLGRPKRDVYALAIALAAADDTSSGQLVASGREPAPPDPSSEVRT